MIIDHIRMLWRLAGVVVVVGVAAGCTKPNPLSCSDGLCSDPAFPFCDVDGSFGDTRETCVAVDCAPMQFEACRADLALTCNASGDNFDAVQCQRGCDAASGGCRLCDPNETACTNGKLATCDATGAIVSSETCALGCFEDQPRCRDIDPSNGLAQFLDMVPNPSDVDLTNAFLNTGTGELFVNGTKQPTIPSFLVPAAPGGASIRVFVADHAHLSDLQFGGPAALAIIARHEIVLDGRITVAGGSVSFSECLPGLGIYDDTQTTAGGLQQIVITGDGGGGHATAGAQGGSVDAGGGPRGGPGGKAGVASGTESLVPLRGGCPGGGAIQLSSGRSVTINGIVDARGGAGEPPTQGPTSNGGGGAGGGILIEGPNVTLGSAARLIAKGGAGSTSSGGAGITPDNDEATAAPGWRCAPPDPFCGNGGNGASDMTAATAGETVFYSNANSARGFSSGAGGGGMGRVRINTKDGTYTKSSTTVEAAVLTAGTLKTR